MIFCFICSSLSADFCLSAVNNKKYSLNLNSGSFSVRSCYFSDLFSDIGGALRLEGGIRTVLDDTKFIRCHANGKENGSGGGFFINTKTSVIIHKICMYECTATKNSNSAYIKSGQKEKNVIAKGFFSTPKDKSTVAYALQLEQGKQWIESCNFSKNTVYCGIGPATKSAHSLYMSSNIIHGSSAVFTSMKIDSLSENGLIKNMMFVENSIASYDALLAFSCTTAVIDTISFIKNSCAFAISNNNGIITVKNCYATAFESSGTLTLGNAISFTEKYILQSQDAGTCVYVSSNSLEYNIKDIRDDSCFDRIERYQ